MPSTTPSATRRRARHPAGGAGAQPASGERAGETGEQNLPVDAEPAAWPRSRRGREEADDEVRPDRPPDVHADGTDERRHPQRAEDDADGAAERADADPAADSGPSRSRSRARACTGRSARSIRSRRARPRSRRRAAAPGRRRRRARRGPRPRPTAAPSRRRRASRRDARARGDRPRSRRRGRDRDVRPARERTPVRDDSGSRNVPSTSPSIEPTYPATNEPASASARSRAARTARRVRRGVGRAREDEEQVGEPVQVAEHEQVQVDLLRASRASRSARRQIVRATWSRAAASVRPGRTKLRSSGSRR